MSIITTDNITGKVSSFIKQSFTGNDTGRQEALSTFERMGIPAPKSEEYKFLPIARILEKNFNFSDTTSTGKIDNLDAFLIPGLKENRIVFVNGVFSQQHSAIENINGLTLLPLKQALNESNTIAIKHFGRYSSTETNSISAWNKAAWTDGIFLHVSKNVQIEKPISIYHIVDATETEQISTTRNLIVVDANSELTIIEKFDSTGKQNHFLNLVTEAAVDENASLTIYSIQNDTNQRFQHAIVDIYQKNSSRVNTYTFSMAGKMYRNNLQLTLDGEGIESHMYGLYLLNHDTIADNHTVVDHKKPNSYSNEMYKGIMDEQSKGVFNGKIFVRPQAQKTNAFQANRNILLTDKATVNTKPQLEIWADDVKCSHGCTTGQLDEEAMFYLRSRGIEKNSARAMMLYAFAGEVLDQIKNPQLKEYIDHAVSEWLHKNF